MPQGLAKGRKHSKTSQVKESHYGNELQVSSNGVRRPEVRKTLEKRSATNNNNRGEKDRTVLDRFIRRRCSSTWITRPGIGQGKLGCGKNRGGEAKGPP